MLLQDPWVGNLNMADIVRLAPFILAGASPFRSARVFASGSNLTRKVQAVFLNHPGHTHCTPRLPPRLIPPKILEPIGRRLCVAPPSNKSPARWAEQLIIRDATGTGRRAARRSKAGHSGGPGEIPLMRGAGESRDGTVKDCRRMIGASATPP
jgi:hypothetical protein